MTRRTFITALLSPVFAPVVGFIGLIEQSPSSDQSASKFIKGEPLTADEVAFANQMLRDWRIIHIKRIEQQEEMLTRLKITIKAVREN